MVFQRFYLGCLAHASYLIGSRGVGAVVDPQRDVDQYIEAARTAGVEIRYVIETHLHADFVSGHVELARKTGATIVISSDAHAEFEHLPVGDGYVLKIGELEIEALATPGHTPESMCWLVRDTSRPDTPMKLLTGDTLFIGDVGRPDLAGGRGHSAAEMAGVLFDSIHQKILRLPDSVEIHPTHGAGSACGRNISSDSSSTIGIQRTTNYALRPMSREAFIEIMTTDLPEAPRYFPFDAEINRKGARPLSEVAATRLSPEDAERQLDRGAIAVDVRDASAFGAGHVPGSINIGLGGQYASWAGTLLPLSAPIVIVADSVGSAEEAVMRLARVGIESVAGYLDGGIAAWSESRRDLATTPQWSIDELHERLAARAQLQIIDVRRPAEYAAGHVPNAINLPLSDLEKRSSSVDLSKPTAVICAGGYRSSAAASLMERLGSRELYNVVGGTAAWTRAGYETIAGSASASVNDAQQ